MNYSIFFLLFIFIVEAEIFNQNDTSILFPLNGPIPPNVNSCYIVDANHALSIGPAPTGTANQNKDIFLLIAYVLDLGLIFVLAVVFKAHVNLRRNGSGDISAIRFAKGPLSI